MPPTIICPAPVADCHTIDSTNDPTLNNAGVAFEEATEHGDTIEAGDRLRDSLTVNSGTRRAMIVGHGSPGTIVTGTGTLADDIFKRISLDNVSIWNPDLSSRLRGETTALTLFSCETAANEDGADLLVEVANCVDAPVSGFTGLIFISATGIIRCEKLGVWRHVKPGQPLSPRPAPSYEFEAIVHLKLKYGEEYRKVNIKDVFAAHFSDPAQGDKRAFSWEGEDAQKLVGTINFAEPSEIDGAPLALNTGVLEVEYLIEEKPDRRSFVIFNGRLLYDQTTPNTFYFASPALAESLYRLGPESL